MENSLAAFEEEAERNLVTVCQEKKQLLKKAHELKRKLLLCQKKQELVDVLNPQVSCGRVSEPCVPAGHRDVWKDYVQWLSPLAWL